jgi:acyl carrier protein
MSVSAQDMGNFANRDKYTQCFVDSFCVDPAVINEGLEYNAIPEWDSIGHMALVSALEDAFSISLDIDDVVDFSSYSKGMEILQKYSVDLG